MELFAAILQVVGLVLLAISVGIIWPVAGLAVLALEAVVVGIALENR